MPEAPSARLGLIAPSDAGDALTIWPDQAQAMVATIDAKAMIFASGARNSRPQSTPSNPGTVGLEYTSTGDGGIDRDTGTSWVTVKPGLFSTLPTLSGHAGDGIDEGMEIRFQTAGMVTAGVPPWTLRYNAGSSSAYKWELMSGTPILVSTDAATTISTLATWVDFPGALDMPLPQAGDWMVDFGARITHSAAGSGVQIVLVATGLSAPAVAGGTTTSAMQFRQADTTSGAIASVSRRMKCAAISGTLKMQGFVNTAGSTTSHRWMSALPVRIG